LNKKHLIIHGHFYQPPRENPWTDEIDPEFSAAPFHDWNERILQECYKPNTEAVIVNSHGDIIRRVNNYEYLSFNFGPTLFSWLRKKHRHTYEKIIDADKKSIIKNNGQGNAIAQVYNHIIMPLASEQDKITQVKWGVKDFEFHFARKPAGMWLAETACNNETLKVLADEGIKFTILDPSQAYAIRKIGSEQWVSKPELELDTSRPYRFFTNEKFIDVFFYNGKLAREIAFDDLIFHSEKLMDRIVNLSYGFRMISAATDGETFGHHKHFADRSIAYLFSELTSTNGFSVTNYSNFLKLNPPDYEVILDNGPLGEGNSWSCAHGVGRWSDDCGCHTGGENGWNQKWRKTLRFALNDLAVKLDYVFIKATKHLLKDHRQARNEYIDIMLNPDSETIEKFFYFNSVKYLDQSEVNLCLKLLEMQKYRMFMFTSCGWFFSDITNIETIQILKYAAKAVELTADATGNDFENVFLKNLMEVKGNTKSLPTAADVYRKKIKPLSKSKHRIRIM
jgi:alpha-amylase/alpha-mannosidase (GH57 family)